ncbi:carbon monoxide dehydrogenase, partial [Planctomycetota bacterium]
MSTSIAVSGKGGTGKSTLSGLIIRDLIKGGSAPVLAVDADPNTSLGEIIGMPAERTVGSTLAEFFGQKLTLPAGLSKEMYLQMRLNEILAEGKGVDVLTMGRGEGQGCYCFPNLMVRKFVDELSDNYKFVVMDNQAGMEHLSRRTTDLLDVLFLVASPTIKGVRTAGTISRLVKELELS